MKNILYFIVFCTLVSFISIPKDKRLSKIDGIYYKFFSTDIKSNELELSILFLKNNFTYSYFNFLYGDGHIFNCSNEDTFNGIWEFVSNNEIKLTNNYWLQNDTIYWIGSIMPSVKNMFLNKSMFAQDKNMSLCFSEDKGTAFYFKKYELLNRKEKKFIKKIHTILLNNNFSVPSDIRAVNLY